MAVKLQREPASALRQNSRSSSPRGPLCLDDQVSDIGLNHDDGIIGRPFAVENHEMVRGGLHPKFDRGIALQGTAISARCHSLN